MTYTTTANVHHRWRADIWWRYVAGASRELTSGESSGGSKASTDGCSSTKRRRAKPMANNSPTVPIVADCWNERLLRQRPLPYFLRLRSVTYQCVLAPILVDLGRIGAQPQRGVGWLHPLPLSLSSPYQFGFRRMRGSCRDGGTTARWTRYSPDAAYGLTA